MRTDRIKTLLAALVTECKILDDLVAADWQHIAKLERQSDLDDETIERLQKRIADLERQNADLQSWLNGMQSKQADDGELLGLLVEWWRECGAITAAKWVRIEELIEERNAADGLAHDADRD